MDSSSLHEAGVRDGIPGCDPDNKIVRSYLSYAAGSWTCLLENPVNHKLRVLVRVEVDPGHVTLEVTGCLTQSDSPALLHIMRRAGRLGAVTDVTINLHGASHLDPEVLLDLRRIAEAGTLAGPDTWAAGGTGQFRISLDEPADLPLCLLHVGADGEVLADLDGQIRQGQHAGAELSAGQDWRLESGLGEASSPAPAEPDTVDGYELSDYFEGTLDPAATVRALSDTALCQLADALYRHLDTSSPSFGAHTWYELATEEIQNRHLTDAIGPAEGELAAGPALA
ncbi:MAG: hypothetical protein JWO49_388 [Arthrobacter sp.]|nr:hypothetical protein [Arthrobacter sp.]MCU1548029.1 hypothetical protein [Arthrobacter sp.]